MAGQLDRSPIQDADFFEPGRNDIRGGCGQSSGAGRRPPWQLGCLAIRACGLKVGQNRTCSTRGDPGLSLSGCHSSDAKSTGGYT